MSLSLENKIELLNILKNSPIFMANPYVKDVFSHPWYNSEDASSIAFDWSLELYLTSEPILNGFVPFFLTPKTIYKFRTDIVIPFVDNYGSKNIYPLDFIESLYFYVKRFDIFKLNFSFNSDGFLISDTLFSEYLEITFFKEALSKYRFWELGKEFFDFFYIIPEIFLFSSFLIFFTFIILIKQSKKINLTIFLSLFIFIFTLYLYLNSSFHINYNIFNFSFTSDYYIYSCKVIILTFSIIFLFLISHFVKVDNIKSYEYVIIYFLIIFSLLLLLGVNDFIGLFLCLELQSLSLYILATYKTTSTYSTEAGIKYFILGALATGMILFGISIIYGFSGTINFNDLIKFNQFISLFPYEFEWRNSQFTLSILHYFVNFFKYIFGDIGILHYGNDWVFEPITKSTNIIVLFTKFNFSYYIGFMFILIGIFFKLGVAPFHMWLPDVYQGSPTITTAFFALIPKLALIFLFIRLIKIHFYLMLGHWFLFFYICSILSMFIGAFGALYQIKIKRLIAYSAIFNMGFIILSLSNFTLFNIISAFFYANIYISLNLLFFSILITLRKYNYVELKNINDLSSLSKNNKVLALFLALNLFSIAGIPPLMGFFSKLMVLFVTVNNDMWFILFIVLFLSMVSVFYYLRLIKIIFFDLNDNFTFYYPPTKKLAYIIVFLSFLNIFFFFFPNLFFIEIINIIFTLL